MFLFFIMQIIMSLNFLHMHHRKQYYHSVPQKHAEIQLSSTESGIKRFNEEIIFLGFWEMDSSRFYISMNAFVNMQWIYHCY